MKIKTFKWLVYLIAFLSLTLVTTRLTYADTCGGSASTSYTRHQCDLDSVSGTYTCGGTSATSTGSCAWQGSFCLARLGRTDQICSVSSDGKTCNLQDDSFQTGNGCVITPTGGGATCGNGTCESGETAASCPSDCGGGGGGSTPGPTSPPANGSCGSCSSCGASSSSECALINGVCSKAGYCSGGGGSGPYCGNYNPYCGFSTGGACNASGPNGPPYTCIYCPATKPDDNWVGLGQFQYPNCTNSVCGNAGTPGTPTWIHSNPPGISDGAVVTPRIYYPYFSSPGANVDTTYLFLMYANGVLVNYTSLTQGQISYGNPSYYPLTILANTDYKIIIYHSQSVGSACLSAPLTLLFTTKVAAQPAPTLTFTGSPTSVSSGGSTTLTWSSTNATSCTSSGNWSGSQTLSGSLLQSGLTTNKSYILTCSNATSNVSKTVNISVNGSQPAPVVNITATPSTLTSGKSSTLTWTTTDATSCTASGSWSGSVAINGSTVVNNITTNRTYNLSCSGPGGTGTDTATVTVSAALAPSVNLTASPTTLVGPGNVKLTWTSTNATSCTASGGWSGAKAFNGSQVISNVSTSQIYDLSCSNANGSDTDTATVGYTAPKCTTPAPTDPAPPVCAPNPPSQNGSITWTWPAVPGADLYSFDVVNATTGISVGGYATGLISGQANFNCRPNQPSPDTCSKKTILPPGNYRSLIRAASSTGACGVSATATYPAPPAVGVALDLCPAVAWWQSGNGSIFTQGNIQSTIPATCTAPGCINSLIQDDAGGTPGFAIGGASSNTNTGTGNVSSKNWIAQSGLLGRVPDYDSFVSLIPVSITPSDPGATCGGGTFNAGGATTGNGYYWYRHKGNVSITSDVTLNPGRKVILFVDGDLNISGKISYNPGNSFFMPIVKGNINVAPTVTTSAGTPTLTGIFYCGGQFSTGSGSGPLSVLGSVVANGGVNLDRDLGDQNHYESSESFTVSPDLLLNYPGDLSFKRPVWKEVAP